jgi:hypothetical protein
MSSAVSVHTNRPQGKFLVCLLRSHLHLFTWILIPSLGRKHHGADPPVWTPVHGGTLTYLSQFGWSVVGKSFRISRGV